MTDRRAVAQFRRFVVEPTLRYLDPLVPYSEAAVALLVGTAVHESGLEFFDQWTGPDDKTLGPALGFFEIEEATFRDVYDRFLDLPKFVQLKERVRALTALEPSLVEQLVSNLRFQTAIARVRFFMSPRALPAADDIEGLAATWKRDYNTLAGAGTTAQWLFHYKSFVA
jgi:hypothetical protein